jgi:pyrroline-5-carboxylate reductase
MTIGFIGGGRVTRILLGGWARAHALPSRVLVHEPDEAAFSHLTAFANGIERARIDEASATDVVFLALHPPKLREVLPVLRPLLTSRALVVSLAPKVTLGELESGCGTSRVARIIPNAPSIVGQGYNPVTFSLGMDTEGRAEILRLFEPLGETPEVEEQRLEAYAILTAMGPTYFWFQWQTLRELGLTFGLRSDDVDVALSRMLTGSVSTMFQSGLSPSAVMDLVPVKPLAQQEPQIAQTYKDVLVALHARIAPERVTA